jgi:hypothetical protein
VSQMAGSDGAMSRVPRLGCPPDYDPPCCVVAKGQRMWLRGNATED